MPYSTSIYDIDYKKRTIRNINKLMNDEPLNIAQCLDYFKEPYMVQFFEIYREYACEPSSFLHSILTTISALSDGIRLSNVISHNDMPINLMKHIIGEPGSQKSNLIYVVRRALNILETLFPSVFVKKKDDIPAGVNIDSRDYHLIVQSDTKLGLTKTLAARGNVYVISDEIDMFNNRFGVYGVNDEKTIAGSKLLCQGFDGIKEEARATGSSIFTIKHSTISLLGTSTGDKLWTNTYRFAQSTGSDGLAVRLTYHILPFLPMNEPPLDYLVFFPNLVHVLIMIILMSKKKPNMVFRQLIQDIDNRPLRVVPKFMMEEYERQHIDLPVVQKISINRPMTIANAKPIDQEQDDSLISAHTAVRRIIHQYLDQTKEESLKSDNNSLSRILFNKSGVKFPRYCATLQLLYYSIKYCRELTKFIRFYNGLHIIKTVDLNNLNEFFVAADHLINQKFEQKKTKETYDDHVILPIKKPSVLAAKHVYDHSLKTAIKLFKLSDIEELANQRKISSNLPSSINIFQQNNTDLNIIS